MAMTGITYTEPLLTVLLLIGFAGLVPRFRGRPARSRLMAASLLGLLIVSWPPAEWLFAQVIELPYRDKMLPDRSAQAIVVLSGSGDNTHPDLPVAIPGPGSYARSRYAAWLYHNWKSVPIIVSGGVSAGHRPAVAAVMAHTIRSEGVPARSVFEESRSLNTRENAAFTAGLLRKMGIRQITLVAHADSMLRAELCFRKEDILVVSAPIGHRAPPDAIHDLLPSWSAVRGNEITLHEVLGLVWYKLRGWI